METKTFGEQQMSAEYNPLQSFNSDSVYKKGSIMSKLYAIADNNGVSTDPDTISFQLIAPDEKTQVAGTPTKITGGLYRIGWTIPTVAQSGRWVLTVIAILALKSQTETISFLVE